MTHQEFTAKRKRHWISQRTVAKYAKCCQSRVSSFERGYAVSERLVEKMVLALNFLVEGEVLERQRHADFKSLHDGAPELP